LFDGAFEKIMAEKEKAQAMAALPGASRIKRVPYE